MTQTPHQIGAIRHPWVYRARVSQLVMSATLSAVIFWAINAGLDSLWLTRDGLSNWAMPVGDALLSVLFGALVFKLMLMERARHGKVVQQLEMIADMNHHIRNALENIQLSAYVSTDRQFFSDIRESVDRIQWALREVLPKTNEEQ